MLESLGLKKIHNLQCIYFGVTIPGYPPLYVGLYVDDFIYFSESSKVKHGFETKFNQQVTTNFDGPVTHFLGLSIQCQQHLIYHVSITVNQEPFINVLLVKTNLHLPSINSTQTPYQPGFPVNKIPTSTLSDPI